MNQYQTIRITKETYYRLLEVKHELLKETGKAVTLDDAMRRLLEARE